PHALAVALNDQPIAVVFDLVDPVGAGRHLCSRSRNAGLERRLTHAGKICSAPRNANRFKQTGAAFNRPGAFSQLPPPMHAEAGEKANVGGTYFFKTAPEGDAREPLAFLRFRLFLQGVLRMA